MSDIFGLKQFTEVSNAIFLIKFIHISKFFFFCIVVIEQTKQYLNFKTSNLRNLLKHNLKENDKKKKPKDEE